MNDRSLMYKSLKLIAIDIIWDIAYWPVWWYTRGFMLAAYFIGEKVIEQENFFGVRIWLKNLFVPMFGQYDWQGRIISFVVRFVNLIVRSILWFFWILICMILLFLWLLLPPLAIYMIINNVVSLVIINY